MRTACYSVQLKRQHLSLALAISCPSLTDIPVYLSTATWHTSASLYVFLVLDERLSFDDHAFADMQSCNYHIRSL